MAKYICFFLLTASLGLSSTLAMEDHNLGSGVDNANTKVGFVEVRNSFDPRAQVDDEMQQFGMPQGTSYENTHTKDTLARKLNKLGLGHFKLEQYGEAIPYFEKTLQEPKCTGKIRVTVCYNLGLSHECLGHYSQAISFYIEALQLPEFPEHRRKQVLHRLLRSHQKVNLSHEPSFDWEANQHIQQSLYTQAQSFFESGVAHYQQANYPEAISYLIVALEMTECMGLERTFVLNALGLSRYRQGQYQKAVPYFENALQIPQCVGKLRELILANLQITRYYLNQNNNQKGIMSIAKAPQGKRPKPPSCQSSTSNLDSGTIYPDSRSHAFMPAFKPEIYPSVQIRILSLQNFVPKVSKGEEPQVSPMERKNHDQEKALLS